MQGIITKWAASGAVVVVALLSVAAVPASAQPVAYAASSKCNIARYYFKLGPTYAERLSVTGTSCATGVDLIRDYFSCSRKGGVKGTCHSTVLGFRCTDQRDYGPDQYIAQVHCTKGRDSATFTYTENT
jgi:hypothetical protein